MIGKLYGRCVKDDAVNVSNIFIDMFIVRAFIKVLLFAIVNDIIINYECNCVNNDDCIQTQFTN